MCVCMCAYVCVSKREGLYWCACILFCNGIFSAFFSLWNKNHSSTFSDCVCFFVCSDGILKETAFAVEHKNPFF